MREVTYSSRVYLQGFPLPVRGCSFSFSHFTCYLNLNVGAVIRGPSWCSQISFAFANYQIPSDAPWFRDFHIMLLLEHTVLCCGFNADACRPQHKKCNILSEPLQIINPMYSKLVI